MVPGHVQGMSMVPPDHPGRGAEGELYSDCLWKTPNPAYLVVTLEAS
jgi:hypothetical protein